MIRYAAKEAYEQYGRSMVSSDMLDQLPSLIKAAEKQ
ncbi:unnamed protein product [Anisakis simplex]|uniref:Uncharacterized protein n=1 Tax=Anisakis simplex TaxID=6269 RepID=A0A3P6PCV4_ANISI|nr:unnamed protein product [Anisakis simplex]